MKIFLSYTLRDGALDYKRLHTLDEIMSPLGQVYIDILHNKSVKPQQNVFDELMSSDVLIACVTPGFFRSEWVQIELLTASQCNLKIVPLFYPGDPGRLHTSVNRMYATLIE